MFKASFVLRSSPSDCFQVIQLKNNMKSSKFDITLTTECRSHPLGMESRAIPNSAVTASSTWEELTAYRPWQARLNNAENGQTSSGSWSAKENKVGEWLQIDLGKETVVTKIATQGRPNDYALQWVSSYKIMLSLNGTNWNAYRSDGSEKVSVV